MVPLGGKSTRRRGHLKPEVVVKWPVSSHVRMRKHHHNPRKKTGGFKSRDEDGDGAEVIFAGVEHINEDAETLFVRVVSSSKRVISNILNRVTRDSSSERKKGHVSPSPI